jgi:multidrug efflux system outer membrane protein
MMGMTSGGFRIIIGCAFTLSLSACSNVGRDYVTPALPSLSSSVLQEAHSELFGAAAPVNDWWNTLEDKQLSALVEQALRHNLDIKIAIATIEEARAVASGSRLNQLPEVTPNASLNRVHESKQSRFGNFGKVDYTSYSAGFDASWELDFWGRVSGQVDADRARLQSAEANLDGVYVTVAAEVARNYIELRGAQARLDIAKKNAENQQQTFEMAQKMESSGRSNGLDLDRAQAQLDSTFAAVPMLEAQVNASMNRLAVLIGQPPDALRKDLRETKPLPTIPSSIAVGDAGALLKRRPDVQAAERELAASVADYNVKVADLYPRVTVDGNVGFVATALGNLLRGDAISAFIQPALRWSALERGRVDARIDAADARTRAQLANFDKTVLGALEEVDAGMVNFSREQQRRERLAQSAKSSAHAAMLAKKRFEAGLDSLRDVLDSESRMLAAKDQLAISETQAAVNVVALYKALGGGWDVAPNLAAEETKVTGEAKPIAEPAELKPTDGE